MRITFGNFIGVPVCGRRPFRALGAPGSPNVAWGEFSSFLEHTELLLPFLPASLIPLFGWTATILEVVLPIGLLTVFFLRGFAVASAILLLTFAAAMTYALGIEPAFSYSVWTASAAAFLLASFDDSSSGIKKEAG